MNQENPQAFAAGTYVRVIQPGGIQPVHASGNFFLVLETNVEVQILRPGAPFAPYQQGDDEEMPPGQAFDRLEIKNNSSVAARVVVYVGFGRRRANRQAVVEPETRVLGKNGTLAAGATVDLTPVLIAGDIRRKCVSVSNPHATLKLELTDEFGVTFMIVQPETDRVVPVSKKMFLKNPNGEAVAYYLGEFFWTTLS